MNAILHLGRTCRNQALDLLCRIGATLRQFAHFLGDDGKATARLAGTSSLDAGVQRQEVGLEGDLVDDADDRRDLLGGTVDLAHGAHSLGNHFARLRRIGLRFVDGACRLSGTIGRRAHDVAEAMQCP